MPLFRRVGTKAAASGASATRRPRPDESSLTAVESAVSRGEAAFAARDVARSATCFVDAVGALSRFYVAENARPRPSAADEVVLTGLVGSIAAATDARLDTQVERGVRAARSALDAIAVRWATNGFDPERFLAARDSVIALTRVTAERSEALARLDAWEALQKSADHGQQMGPTSADIAHEWALASPTEDLLRWCEGIRRYDAASLEDFDAMRESAELMAPALAHFVAGGTILPRSWAKDPDADIGLTTWNILVAILEGGEPATWDNQAARCTRVALAAARLADLHPREMGGGGALTRLFERPNRLLMCAALSRHPLQFHLGAWFQRQERAA